jgi:hypothetical protein
MKIYKNIYLTVFYLVNRYMGSSLVGRISLEVFGLSKVAIIALLFKVCGIKLGYVLFVFIFFVFFDFVLVLRAEGYSRENVEYYFNMIEDKKQYIGFVILYIMFSVLCAVVVLKDILQ